MFKINNKEAMKNLGQSLFLKQFLNITNKEFAPQESVRCLT